jgi:hypothetical protein
MMDLTGGANRQPQGSDIVAGANGEVNGASASGRTAQCGMMSGPQA